MSTETKKEKIPNELEQNVTKVTQHELVLPSKQIIKDLSSPFPAPEQTALTAPAAPNNLLGVCSIQDFSGNFGNHNSDLSQTHNDARGFYTYLYNWYTANYWYIDGAVQSWLYEEPYDHWQNYYGVDAVCIFYHSGHGNMTNTGVFQAPMGGKWNNETWFFSNNKALFGNQRIRYIFWSTCLSCRVGGGLTPISTWWAHDSNPGFRILFGFETTSIDSGDYGKNFWNHWKNGESFTTAWLNASWDITHHQGPTAVASGATQAEATNILFNERNFNWNAVGRNWYQWRWYTAAAMAVRNKSLPKKLMVAELAPQTFTQSHVQEIAKTAGLKNPVTAMSKDGLFSVEANDKTISLDRYGALHIKLAAVNYTNKKTIDEKEAIRIAQEHVKKHNLSAGEEIQFDMIRLGKSAGGHTKDSKIADREYVTETTVQFKQIINGVPVINSNQGVVRVTIDNDGTATNLHSSVKKIANLSPLPKSMAIDPKNHKAAELLSQNAIEASFKHQLKGHEKATLVADSEETGYDLTNMHGRLAVQRIYEVTFEEGLKKLVKVIVPIFE